MRMARVGAGVHNPRCTKCAGKTEMPEGGCQGGKKYKYRCEYSRGGAYYNQATMSNNADDDNDNDNDGPNPKGPKPTERWIDVSDDKEPPRKGKRKSGTVERPKSRKSGMRGLGSGGEEPMDIGTESESGNTPSRSELSSSFAPPVAITTPTVMPAPTLLFLLTSVSVTSHSSTCSSPDSTSPSIPSTYFAQLAQVGRVSRICSFAHPITFIVWLGRVIPTRSPARFDQLNRVSHTHFLVDPTTRSPTCITDNATAPCSKPPATDTSNLTRGIGSGEVRNKLKDTTEKERTDVLLLISMSWVFMLTELHVSNNL